MAPSDLPPKMKAPHPASAFGCDAAWLPASPESRQRFRSLYRMVGRLFRQRYTPPGRLPWFAVDGCTGKPLGPKTLLPELADYLPLLAVAGEHTYVQQQGRIVASILEGGVEPLNPDVGLARWMRRQNPFYFSDLILGLLECHSLGLGPQWLCLAKNQTERLLRDFRRGDGLCKERFLPGGWCLPVCESNSIVTIEILVELYQHCGESRYLEAARELLAPWLQLARDNGAVPQLRLLNPWLGRIPRFARRTEIYLLYKHNLFFLAALDRIAEAMQDPVLHQELFRLTASIIGFFRGRQGMPCYSRIGADNADRLGPPTLKGTLLAEHLCDLSQARQRPAMLEAAGEMVEFWLDQRDPRTGLIPYILGQTSTDVDALTDFTVTLIKMSAAAGDPQWRTAALDLLSAMLEHHLGPYGLYGSVDCRSGKILQSTVETRYTSLFLKPWLLLDSPPDIYGQPGLISLVRDR
jgi:hypothetical protein